MSHEETECSSSCQLAAAVGETQRRNSSQNPVSPHRTNRMGPQQAGSYCVRFVERMYTVHGMLVEVKGSKDNFQELGLAFHLVETVSLLFLLRDGLPQDSRLVSFRAVLASLPLTPTHSQWECWDYGCAGVSSGPHSEHFTC